MVRTMKYTALALATAVCSFALVLAMTLSTSILDATSQYSYGGMIASGAHLECFDRDADNMGRSDDGCAVWRSDSESSLAASQSSVGRDDDSIIMIPREDVTFQHLAAVSNVTREDGEHSFLASTFCITTRGIAVETCSADAVSNVARALMTESSRDGVAGIMEGG